MTHEQYEAAQTVLQMSRLYARAMRECMENAGLLKEGYELHVCVNQEHEIDDTVLLNTIRLERDPSSDGYLENRFINFCFKKEGWVVVHDPIIKSGAVPPTVRTMETAARVYGGREKTEKPTAPDGLWLSAYDNYSPVDGGK